MITIEPTDVVANRTGIITSAGTLLNANSTRRGLIIQNLNGTDKLFVKFGSGATSSSFDVVLKAGSADDDGNGGVLSYDVLSYRGIITIAGTTIRCTATDW